VKLWRATIAALFVPRRLGPIAIVCLSLVFAQAHFSNGDPFSIGLAAVACALFITVAPWSWRSLFPAHRAPPVAHLAAYGLLAGSPAALAYALSTVTDIDGVLLEGSANLAMVSALCWVGGWGLARDITLEASLVAQQARTQALARDAEHAQLLALRAHLDPHFLFNTLNAIAEWCREDPEVAERAILKLSSVLRDLLEGITEPTWPLSKELALARDVWALHQARDPQWFTIAWQVPEPVPAIDLPPLLLLPVVENAVKHGPAKGHRGVLSLHAAICDHRLELTISNPGPYTGPREGGHGVETVRKRILLSYPTDSAFDISANGDQTDVRIVIPTLPSETLP
jgi:two-component system, LytTR family, sensor histidine kinase AlgZ